MSGNGLGEDKPPPLQFDGHAFAREKCVGAHELSTLFDFLKRFPHIAPYNAMLLHVQNPQIQFALRAPVWERKYERRVVPGGRPYVILQTMGPVAFVFDLSDTKPMNPNRDLIPETITNPFRASGQPPPGALKRLIVACLKVVAMIVDDRMLHGAVPWHSFMRPGGERKAAFRSIDWFGNGRDHDTSQHSRH